MSLSPSVAKKPKLPLKKQISDLADADLAEIFKRLPLFDRLIVSEVSRRWLGLSRKAWLDVKHLDLSPIPGKHIAAIIKQCPNLQSVFALGKSFGLNELVCLSKSSQWLTVKLCDCTFAVKDDPDHRIDAFVKTFGENAQQASWNELIIHNARFEDRTVAAYSCGPSLVFSAEFLPVSLTRLQLSGLRVSNRSLAPPYLLVNALDRLQNLECLILHSTPDFSHGVELVRMGLCFCHNLFEKISALRNLKELCIGALVYSYHGEIGRFIATLPNLEVLFLDEVDCVRVARDLEDLITKNSILRILVLSGGVHGNSEPVDLPARKRFPGGFGSDPLPLLHIFAGKGASEKLRFSKSATNAALIYPINEPMPQFLEREDIAPIFEGVWVAEKIKEAALHGGRLWDYDFADRACSIQNVQTENGQ